MAHGCFVTPPSGSGWFGEQMERAQTFSVTRGEAKSQMSNSRRFSCTISQFGIHQEKVCKYSSKVKLLLNYNFGLLHTCHF